MRFYTLSIPLAATLAAAADITCELPDCPNGWSASGCNNGSPSFCCPGGSIIQNDDAFCCIGGDIEDVFSDRTGECKGGTKIKVTDDSKAYTSSVEAALASMSGTSDSGNNSNNNNDDDDDDDDDSSSNSATQTTTDSDSSPTSDESSETSSSEDAAAALMTGLPGLAAGLMAAGVVVAGEMI